MGVESVRVLGFDLESTGLDTSKDRIIEVGYALWDSATQTLPMAVSSLLYDQSYPAITAEITKLTGISEEHLKEFGLSPSLEFVCLDAFCKDHKVDYICAHSGENFDKPLLLAELDRNRVEAPTLRALPWLDSKTDIPYPESCDSRRLKHLAGEHGFLNPFPHRALWDVVTMLKILSHYKLEDVIAYSKVPWVTVRALVSYDDRQLAKDRRFSWEKCGDKVYEKSWVKRIKESELAAEQKACSFKVVRID